MGPFLQLIRWKNLLIVLASQLIVWTVLQQGFESTNDFKLGFIEMLLLLLSTTLIAAAGYIINDYFDIKIDSINRPDTLIIGNQIHKITALSTHIIFNLTGLLLAAWVAFRVGVWWLCSIQLLTITLLWFYSTHFKRMSLIGNLVVSLLTAMSILILLCFEPGLYRYIGADLMIQGHYNPAYLIFGISIFAFLINMMREIVKDMEDYVGDAALGCKTFPIVHGLQASSRLVTSIGVLSIMLLVAGTLWIYVQTAAISSWIIIMPAIALIIPTYLINTSLTTRHFAKVSALLKIVMIIGLIVIIGLANI